MFMTLYCAFSKLIHIIFTLREYGNVLKNKILGNDISAQHVPLVCIAFEINFEFFVA